MKIIKGVVFFAGVAMSPLVLAETLADVVQIAIATNPEVLIKTSGADAKEYEVRLARAGYLPTINLTVGIGYENSRNATTIAQAPITDRKDQDRTRREGGPSLSGR